MAAGHSVGTVFVELDLDASRYLKSQHQLLKDATSTSLNIEQNFKNMGIKSSAEFDLMRQKITNSYNMIVNSAKSTANDIIRAEEAKNAKLKQINDQQYGVHTGFLDKIKNNWVATSAVIASAMAAAYSVTHIAHWMKAGLEAMDKLDEMSQKVGVNTTTLQVFGHMAKLAGTDIEGVSRALGIMAKNLVTTEMKGEDASQAFKTLGIEAKDSNGILKSSDQLIVEIADKFATMEDGTQKTALAMMVFGKSGKDMIPILNQGGDAIKEVHDRMQRLGILIDEKTIRAAGAFNDRLDEMGLMSKALSMRVMGELTPALDNLVMAFLNSDTTGQQMNNTAQTIATGLKLLASAAIGTYAAFDILGTAIGETIAAGVHAIKQLPAALTGGKVEVWTGGSSIEQKLQSYGSMIDAFWKKQETSVISARKKIDPNIPIFNEKAAKEVDNIGKQIEKELNKITLTELEQIDKQADEWLKLGVNKVKVQEWVTAKYQEYQDKITKINNDGLEAIAKHREAGTKEFEKLLSEEAEFAMTENERAMAKIMQQEEDKLWKINVLLQEGVIDFQQYENAKTRIITNAARNRTEKEANEARRVADINYQLVENIKGMEQTAFNMKMNQIEAAKNKYIKDGGDVVLAAQWAADQQTKALIALGQKGDDVTLGMKAAFLDMYQSQKTWGQHSFDLTKSFFTDMKSTASTVFFDAIKGDLKDFETYWDSFLNSILKKFTDVMADMLVNWITNQITGYQLSGSVNQALNVGSFLQSTGGYVNVPLMDRNGTYTNVDVPVNVASWLQQGGGNVDLWRYGSTYALDTGQTYNYPNVWNESITQQQIMSAINQGAYGGYRGYGGYSVGGVNNINLENPSGEGGGGLATLAPLAAAGYMNTGLATGVLDALSMGYTGAEALEYGALLSEVEGIASSGGMLSNISGALGAVMPYAGAAGLGMTGGSMLANMLGGDPTGGGIGGGAGAIAGMILGSMIPGVGTVLGAIGGSALGSVIGGFVDDIGGFFSDTFSSVGDFFSDLFHEGGIVGSSAHAHRMVSPLVFAGAPRLHKGLAADEFPAILQKGEQVIKRDDVGKRGAITIPIHIVNFYGDSAGIEALAVKVGDVLDRHTRRGYRI